MKIKSVITAIGNIKLNQMLKENNFNVLCTDIQYKEGILEFLENNKNIDYIILNEDLDGVIETKELLKEVKNISDKIKIILVSNKTIDEEKIINQMNSNVNKKKQKNDITEDKEIQIQEIKRTKDKKINPKIKNIINQKQINMNNGYLKKEEEIERTLIAAKKLTNNSKNKLDSNKNIFNRKTLPINNLISIKENQENKNNKVISILGPNGIGKSVFSILLAQCIEGANSIVIDFDILNNSLHTLLGIKNYEEKIKNGIKKNDLVYHIQDINKYIIKTNKKIDILSGMNLIFDSKYKLSYKKLKQIVDILKEKYNYIIFDTSSECFLDYTKEIINISDESIFISGANLLEIKKSQKLLDIYTNEWEINRRKFNIVFNKCTDKSVDDEILKEIFSRYFILGKIELNDYYDLLINKNMTQKTKLRKEIEKIKKQIIKEKYDGAYK